MEKVLIRKDEHLITQKKESVAKCMNWAQQAVDLFKPFGIELNLQEVHRMIGVGHGLRSSGENVVHNFVVDKIISKMGTATFNGVPLKTEKIKEMIDLPDTTELTKKIHELANTCNKQFHVDHLQIIDGIVSIKDSAHEEIDAKHTHHTETPYGHELAQKLTGFSKRVQELSDYYGRDKNGRLIVPLDKFEIPGLQVVYKALDTEHQYIIMDDNQSKLIVKEATGHKLDLNHIRRHEKRNA